jgi:hypothetical protein
MVFDKGETMTGRDCAAFGVAVPGALPPDPRRISGKMKIR